MTLRTPWLLPAASLVVAVVLGIWILRGDRRAEGGGGELTVLCAAGIKAPVLASVEDYKREFGTDVRLVFGGSGTLFGGLKTQQRADIYLAGDDSYVLRAREQGLVSETFDLATMRPVIAVPKGNPKSITRLADLLRNGVRFGIGSPDAAAVGKIARKVAKGLGFWSQLEAAALVQKPTVNELANDLRLGGLDAAVIWDATAAQHELEVVADPDLAQHPRQVALGVLTASARPTLALHFARFLTAPERGQRHVAEAGFSPSPGDAWVARPRLTLMSGAMLRPAIEATLAAFERREGCSIERIYNGCGILVAQMRAGALPDAYFACDQSFLDSVAERFHAGTTVSGNDIVLATQKGNPLRLRALGDLTKRELRIGLGHPDKSALGALTKKLLAGRGLGGKVRPAVESPTGDLLVNQLRAGALDAILVYRSNAAHILAHCEIVELGAGARATQPYAVAKNTQHGQLMARLEAALRSAESKRQFGAMGFHWLSEGQPR